MWENETIVLVTSLKKRILGGEKKAVFSRISTDNAIPPFIKALFQSKVEKYIKTESPFSLQPTTHFDLKPDDLEGMKSRFTDVLREAAVFPADEVDDILKEALVLRLDYLIKPSDTMRRLLFDEGNDVSISKMEMVLDPYTKLLPYAERLLKECRRLGHNNIEMDEYGKIVMDLFGQMLNGESVKVVLHDFSVLTDFLSETKGEEMTRVDGDVMQEFLADRNLWNFRRALDIELKLGKVDFDAVDLEMTMKRYLEMKAEFGEEESADKADSQARAAAPAPEIIEEQKEDMTDSWDLNDAIAESQELVENSVAMPEMDVVTPESIPEPTDSSDELTDEMTDETNEEVESAPEIDGLPEDNTYVDPEPATVAEVEEAADSKPEPEAETEVETVSEDPVLNFDEDNSEESETTFSDTDSMALPTEEELTEDENLEEKKQPASQMRIIRRTQSDSADEDNSTSVQESFEADSSANLLGLKSLIDDRTQKVFVKKLFDGDKENYQNLLEKLEEAESWRVAKILIDNELFKRDVDPFSREAIKLVDIVYSRYYPEEGVGGV